MCYQLISLGYLDDVLETLNAPDVLGPHHARAELTYGAVWMR